MREVIMFLRSKNQHNSISTQQSFILDYAKKHKIAINLTELDDSACSLGLEDRDSFLKFLASLREGDTILVYDVDMLSNKVGELVKIFNCIFKHNINVHICSDNIIINKDTSITFIFDYLSEIRESNKQKQFSKTGRPKGSFSKSKFDKYKEQIIKMLEDGVSVNQIASTLNVSRSSLKDYINSRSLKEIAGLKNLSINSSINLYNNNYIESKRCPLTKK